MTEYKWQAITLDKKTPSDLTSPTGMVLQNLRANLLRPISGDHAPFRMMGRDPETAHIVVLADGPPIAAQEAANTPGRASVPRYAIVVNQSDHWECLGTDNQLDEYWDAGSVDFDFPSGTSLFVEKWLVALVVAQQWSFLDVTARLAKLDDPEEATNLQAPAQLYETFRLRKNRLWWLRASSLDGLQGSYAQLQERLGCKELHDQVLEETTLWREHVARKQDARQNSLLLVLTYVAGALGLIGVIATVTSVAGLGIASLACVVVAAIVGGLLMSSRSFREAVRDVRSSAPPV